MTKSEIRLRLMELKKYIKLSVLAAEYNISQSALSKFISNDIFSYEISYDKIYGFYMYCIDKLSNFT